MKRSLALLLCLLLALALFGCGTKEAEKTDTGAAGHPEEVADSTRLDSAAGVIDSMADMVTDSAKALLDAGNEATKDAAKEATGQ